jgi:hypothetical protein
MVQKLEIADCMKMINAVKANNRRKCPIKVSQIEYFKDRHPKVFLQTFGLKELETELKKMGYSVSYSKEEKQISVGYDMRGNIKKLSNRDLHTTNLVISW